jgi:Uma2 family endonuclease
MPASSKVRFTYEDYLAIPDDTAHRYEIVDGELFVSPTPVPRHQQVVVSLTRILSVHVLTYELGEVCTGPMTVRLSDDTVVEPDLIFVRADRLDVVHPRMSVLAPPDLVVEVLSPSNRSYDRNLKRRRYQLFGVLELWILDPDEHTLEVWRPEATAPERPREVVTWRVGEHAFDIPLADIFRE